MKTITFSEFKNRMEIPGKFYIECSCWCGATKQAADIGREGFLLAQDMYLEPSPTWLDGREALDGMGRCVCGRNSWRVDSVEYVTDGVRCRVEEPGHKPMWDAERHHEFLARFDADALKKEKQDGGWV